jgi:hypothetical protein
MLTSTGRFKLTAVAMTVLMAAGGLSTQAMAAPFATIGASKVTAEELVETVQYRRRVGVAPRARYAAPVRRRNNNAAVAAAIVGIGVLGLAAAAAASQRQERRGTYYSDDYGRPVDAYGRPIYQSAPVQHYRQPGFYYQQPGYYYQQPGYHDQRPGYYNPGLTNAQIREQQRIARKRAKIEFKQRQAQQHYFQHQYGYGYHPRRAPIDPFR